MTILLSVSALYIVVFGNIPLVGYLTKLDSFIISMFFLLSICVALHQFSNKFSGKKEKFPFRMFIVRIIDLIGRVMIIPIAVYTFLYMFEAPFGLYMNEIITVMLVVLAVSTFVLDIGGVRKSLRLCMVKINEKTALTESKFTRLEVWMHNLYFHYKFSFAAPIKVKSSSIILSVDSDDEL